MNEEELEQFLWQRLEGTLAPADRRRLTARLAADPAARRREREVADLARRLDEVPEAAPPGALRWRIRRALCRRREARPPVRAWPGPRHRLAALRSLSRLGYLAAGLVVGVLVGRLLPGDLPPGVDETALRGAVSSAPTLRGDAWQVEIPALGGRLSLSHDGPLLVAELELAAASGGELRLAAPGLALVSADHAGLTAARVEGGDGSLVLTAAGRGRSTLAATLGDGAAPFTVVVAAGGEIVLERRLRLDDLPVAGGEEKL